MRIAFWRVCARCEENIELQHKCKHIAWLDILRLPNPLGGRQSGEYNIDVSKGFCPQVLIMTTVNLDDAKARLPEIISELNPGEQIVIIKNGEPMAFLTRSRQKQWPCAAGSAKDTQHWMSPDFDAPLEDFREYME